MKFTRILFWPLAAALMTSSGFAAASDPDYGQIEIATGRLLEQGHYTRQKLDADVSQRFLKNYLDALDYNHLFFTQQDVDAFTQKYGTILGDDVLLGNPAPADQIFKVYQQRVEDRVAKIEQLLKTTKFDFTGNETVAVNREKAPWPADEAAADALWQKRIEGEVLQETLYQANTKKAEKSKTSKPANHEVHPKKTTDDQSGKTDSAKSDAKPLTTKSADSEKKTEMVVSGSSSDVKSDATKEVATQDGNVLPKTPVQVVAHRYEQVLRNLHDEMTKADETKIFLDSLAQTYDPHSNYFSKEDNDNFNIDMKLSLVGIGAQLQSDNGLVKVTDVLPGGPAQIDGRLKIGDRITGVAQGDKDFTDITDMRLQKVVDMIRGKKDTIVRLQVIPVHASDPSARSVIVLKRDVVKIREQEAQAQLIERKDANGHPERIGWITLPGFYANLDGEGPPKSCTADVQKLLDRLESEHIDGLVIDLRLNGGGSLAEAINLAGLFIGSGPVVQTKNANGNVQASDAEQLSKPAYSGPMIVLTNKLSASASEIFAGAMQDYKRAVIVGDSSTFGKGTVQTILDIGHWVPFLGSDPSEAGSLKLTIQKFYRISGQSTQLRGVIPDIKLPSVFDRPDLFGESSLKDPLPYDEVDAVPHQIWNENYHVARLRERSAARVAHDVEFRWVDEDMKRNEAKAKQNQLSLNEKKRVEELDAEKKREAERKAMLAKLKQPQEKVFTLTLENLNQPQLQLAKYDKKATTLNEVSAETENEELGGDEDTDGKPPVDPVKDETLNIMDDIVHFEKPRETLAKKTARE